MKREKYESQVITLESNSACYQGTVYRGKDGRCVAHIPGVGSFPVDNKEVCQYPSKGEIFTWNVLRA